MSRDAALKISDWDLESNGSNETIWTVRLVALLVHLTTLVFPTDLSYVAFVVKCKLILTRCDSLKSSVNDTNTTFCIIIILMSCLF